MRLIKTARTSEAGDHVNAFRTKRILPPLGALLLIFSAGSIFAQIDPGQYIPRSSSRPQTVSRNQLLAPAKALKAIDRASKAMLGGHLDVAKKEIARALDIAPHFAVAEVLQGSIDVEAKNYEAARTLFQEAIDDDPALGGAYVGMAAVMIHDGRFQKALALLDRAEGLLPDAWFVHFAKGWAQLELGNFEAALKQADFAERVAGTNSEKRSSASYLRAMVCIHQHDMDMAKGYLNETVARDSGGHLAALAKEQLERLQPLLASGR